MRQVRCICKKCACVNECEYYKETVEPIINVMIITVLYDDLFTAKIKDVLEEFECEYFE